jgi:subtilisin-like proprotein convertase family protein
LNYEENGSSESQAFDVLLTTGTRSPESQTETPNVQIPDNSTTGVSDSLVLTDVGNVVDENFSVDLNITHPYVGDLTITLTSPSGTTIKLWDQEGGDSDNIVGNFPRDFQPAQSFDAFQGESLSGTWTIKVVDGGPQDVGTLNAWTVTAGGIANCANGEVENRAPNLVVANSNITVNEGEEVTLDASGSSDPDDDAITFNWTQVSGPSVTLNNAMTDTASFTAPQVTANNPLSFQVTATDAKGASSSATVTVTVKDISTPDNGSGSSGGGGGALWSVFGLLMLAARRRLHR